MYCRNCGKEIRDGSRFCPYCGMSCAEEPSSKPGENLVISEPVDGPLHVEPPVPVKPPKKKWSGPKKAFVTLVSLLGVVAVCAAVLTVIVMFSPAKEVSDALEHADYDNAVSVYRSDVQGVFFQEKLLDFLLSRQTSGMLDAYESGELTYEEARGKLEALAQMPEMEAASDCAQQLEMLDELFASKKAYRAAEEYYADGDYAAALAEYKNVVESDSNYDLAQERIVEATDGYREEILNQVGTPESDAAYETAITLVNTALSVLPGDEQLTQKLDELKSSYSASVKSRALTDGSVAISEGRFEDAFSLISDALQRNEGDPELQALLASAQTEYVSYVGGQVADLVSQDDYDGALALIDAALSVLPGNETLQNLRSQTENAKPVRLSDMTVSDSNYLERPEDGEVYVDVIGTVYSPSNLLEMELYEDRAFFTVYLGGAYSRLSGTAAVRDNSDSTNGWLMVYGDNSELLYSVELSRTTAPVTIQADLTGVQWLTFQGTAENWDRLYVLLSELVLFRS